MNTDSDEIEQDWQILQRTRTPNVPNAMTFSEGVERLLRAMDNLFQLHSNPAWATPKPPFEVTFVLANGKYKAKLATGVKTGDVDEPTFNSLAALASGESTPLAATIEEALQWLFNAFSDVLRRNCKAYETSVTELRKSLDYQEGVLHSMQRNISQMGYYDSRQLSLLGTE